MNYLLFFFTPALVFGNMGPQGFHAHLNRYFIETGSFCGDGIQKALDAGFECVHSLEIDPHLAIRCKIRFKENPHVTIWNKDSSHQLWEVIEPIHEEMTFWLDGHFISESPYGTKFTPLMEELEQIKRHPIKTHTILIDDLHCCGNVELEFPTREELVQKVLEINPDYEITFEPGGNEGEYPNNVLVASPKKSNV